MAEQALLKNQLAEKEVAELASLLVKVETQFDTLSFEQQALTQLDTLELKQRVIHLIAVLKKHLPQEFEQAAAVLCKAAVIWHQQPQAVWGSFTAWPLVDYVAEVGLQQPELALTTLKKLTSLFSAEFAIRPFIEQHFELTYSKLLEWTQDENEHVRRLASEGMRPRLPWGKRLNAFCDDPRPILAVLEKLKDDNSLYVRKSVANNLNDISKDHPDKVIELCQRWWTDATTERCWIIRHGLRSLIKAGRTEVFPLLGYTEQPKLSSSQFSLSDERIHLGQALTMTVHLSSQQEQTFVLDYKVHFVKANGQLSSKVFKWKSITLAAGQTISLIKQHSFKPISTRRYYPGEHVIEILINGQAIASKPFNLFMT
jgi:3-methyladenine DNA glycosylase AlkC